MPSVNPSTRSSITVTDRGSPPLSNAVTLDLEADLAQEEKNIEAYGGDDPHEPQKDKNALPSHGEHDPNMVTWDSPNDPTNPQNWSKPYKWFLTVVCCVMTVNV